MAETPCQGNITLGVVNIDGQKSLCENNVGSELTEPCQISNEILVWTQILE